MSTILEPTSTTATLEVTGAPPTDLTALFAALMLFVVLGVVVQMMEMEVEGEG
jgi:hypothetical protein